MTEIKTLSHDTLLEIIRQSFFLEDSPAPSFEESKFIFEAVSGKFQNSDLKKAKISELLSVTNKNEKAQVIFSHDIDWIDSWHPVNIFKTIKGGWQKKNSLFDRNFYLKNISELITFEKKQEIRSVFNLGNESFSSSFRRVAIRYSINNSYFQKLISLLKEHNFIIGYHSSFIDSEIVKKHFFRLKKQVQSEINFHRSHYLQGKIPQTWQTMDELSIPYELSIGYDYEPGFKYGICHAFSPYNLDINKLQKVKCIPMILADNAFFKHDYNKVMDDFEKCLDVVVKLKGCVNILFHPENMLLKPILWKAYEEIIHICKTKNIDLNPELK